MAMLEERRRDGGVTGRPGGRRAGEHTCCTRSDLRVRPLVSSQPELRGRRRNLAPAPDGEGDVYFPVKTNHR